MNTQRVLIVDDHPVVRRGLRATLDTEPWVEEVLEAENAADAIRMAVTGSADLVVMDVELPDGCGIAASARLAQLRPGARVVILTYSKDEALVEKAVRAGVAGFLLKESPPETTLDALRVVAGGGFVLGPRVGTTLLTAARRGPATRPPPFDQLTERELAILGRLAQGETNARIARELGVAEKTIRNQVSGIFTKIGVADRVHAALKAREAGIDGPAP